jgi:hypothetical protein
VLNELNTGTILSYSVKELVTFDITDKYVYPISIQEQNLFNYSRQISLVIYGSILCS